MTSTAFGERLRREREMRGVSLEEIAAATRINPRYLTALESEQWSQLPGGAFNRGFVRSIARFLGMDEDGLVAEYEIGAKSPNGNGGATLQALPAEAAWWRKWNWRQIAAALAALALVAILVTGCWFAIRHFGPRIAARFHHPIPAGGAH